MKKDSDRLTRELKELAKSHGAVLVGVAQVERFDPRPPLNDSPPRGQAPRDFMDNARSVLSLAQPILNPVLDAPAALAEEELEMVPPDARYPYLEQLYNRTGHVVQDYMLEFIGQLIGQYLMAEGYDAMIFPTTGLHPRMEGKTDREIWEGPSKKWADKYSPFCYTSGPFSHRHAAVRAGLGEFGYNNVVLTPQFGPRQRFNSVITNAELIPDPLQKEKICLREACRLCLDACIMGAISLRDHPGYDDYRRVDEVDRGEIFLDTPARTDPVLCRQRRERIPDSPVRGDCIRICPRPEPSPYLPERLKKLSKKKNDDR